MPQSRGAWWLVDFRVGAVLRYREYEAGEASSGLVFDPLPPKEKVAGSKLVFRSRAWPVDDWELRTRMAA